AVVRPNPFWERRARKAARSGSERRDWGRYRYGPALPTAPPSQGTTRSKYAWKKRLTAGETGSVISRVRKTPPGRRTRCTSRNAVERSERLRATNAFVTRSKDPSAKGSRRAVARAKPRRGVSGRPADAPTAFSSIARVKSAPITRAAP